MKIAVIGAGISGLSVAKMLQEKGHEVIVFERDNRPGGMIKCDRIEGSLFHRTGGHVFNTKYEEVRKWFWSHFDKEKEFKKKERMSVILFDDCIVNYPIENHVYQFSDDILRSFIKEILDLSKIDAIEPSNFEEFLCQRFGEELYHLYFQPYNAKIWKTDLKCVPLSWLDGKLPMPTYQEMLFNNIRKKEEKQFVHSSFYYPNNGGSQFIADRLAENINIEYLSSINSIELIKGKWLVRDRFVDSVVFSGNIKKLPSMLKGVDIEPFKDGINNLRYHGTTSVFSNIKRNPYTWIYLPSDAYKAHRIICTGNLATSNNSDEKTTATVEFTDNVPLAEIMENLSHIPYDVHYLTHHYEEYTYPIQDNNTRDMVSSLKKEMASKKFFLCGRFAEWEYFNMDLCIKSALGLVPLLQ